MDYDKRVVEAMNAKADADIALLALRQEVKPHYSCEEFAVAIDRCEMAIANLRLAIEAKNTMPEAGTGRQRSVKPLRASAGAH